MQLRGRTSKGKDGRGVGRKRGNGKRRKAVRKGEVKGEGYDIAWPDL